MARPFTVDASVFLNAFNPSEACYAESQRVLAWLQEQAPPIIAPTLVLPKVAANIKRVLDELRTAGQVECLGKGRSAQWRKAQISS